MHTGMIKARRARRAEVDLLFLTIQIELSLRDSDGGWRASADSPIEEAYELLRRGASGTVVKEQLRVVMEDSGGRLGRIASKQGKRPAMDSMPGQSDLQRRVGLVVRRLRENGGMSQATLAEMCGITQAAVSQIEGGKRINNINSLERISNALGLSLGRMIELANLEDFEREVLLPEALESAEEVEEGGAVSLEAVMKRLGKR